jgi:ABC-type transport system involved in cytochrome c biogenesis permease subunit
MLCTLSLTVRIVLAQRLPLQSKYDFLLWFLCWLALVYLIVEDRTKVTLPGVFVAGLSAALGAGALLRMDATIWPLAPQQDSIWFTLRSAALYASYAPFVVAVAIEVSSLFYGPLVRREPQVRAELEERYLEFRSYAYRLVMFGFPFLSFALLSNALWRNGLRGHYWAWAQDETWALIAWLVYSCYLHLRTQVRTARALTITVCAVGAAAMTLTFTGVNWLVRLLRLG